jgi:hypothetical protein
MPFPLISLESLPPLEPYLSNRRSRPNDDKAQLTFAAMLFERETYFTAMYTPWGQFGEEPPSAHAQAWQPHPVTDEGRRALSALRRLDGGANQLVFDLFGLKAEALAGVQSVLRPRKSALSGYLVAARFSIDLCRYDEALAALDQAERLAPDHRIALAYRYEALLMKGDSEAIERRIRKVFGPRWSNQLARAREEHDAQIRRHAWRARTATEGERFTRFLKTERQWCEEERDRTLGALDDTAVPESLRVLLPLARRYGVGDDPCRAYFISRTTKAEQERHLAQAAPHLDAIQEWVDTYKPEAMPPEAAAFFWLLEALEEMRVTMASA